MSKYMQREHNHNRGAVVNVLQAWEHLRCEEDRALSAELEASMPRGLQWRWKCKTLILNILLVSYFLCFELNEK